MTCQLMVIATTRLYSFIRVNLAHLVNIINSCCLCYCNFAAAVREALAKEMDDIETEQLHLSRVRDY